MNKNINKMIENNKMKRATDYIQKNNISNAKVDYGGKNAAKGSVFVNWTEVNHSGNGSFSVNVNSKEFKRNTWEKFGAWISKVDRGGSAQPTNAGSDGVEDKIAQTFAKVFTPTAMVDAVKTIATGVDINGNEQDGAYDRYVGPGISILGGGNTILGTPSKIIKFFDRVNTAATVGKETDIFKYYNDLLKQNNQQDN